MKIERISENKIKVTLTLLDLRHYDIDMTAASITPEKVEEIFHNMLRIAEQEADFLTYDSQLMIEARPNTGENDELIMYITRMDGKPSLPETRKLTKNTKLVARKKEEGFRPTQAVYRFDKFDTMISCLSHAQETQAIQSDLFSYNQNYYLSVEGSKELVEPWELLLCEHGQKIRTWNALPFLQEHGDNMISTNAIETLIRYF